MSVHPMQKVYDGCLIVGGIFLIFVISLVGNMIANKIRMDHVRDVIRKELAKERK